MKLFEKKDSIINIEEDDLQDAKLSSLDFSDKTTRKRAFLNVLGARLAMKMLFSQKIEATNLYSLYTIHNVIEELDLADIYFQGIKIDVRVVFNKEEIFIPKSHFKLDLLPDVYFVFDLAEDFSGVEFLGFFEPKTLNIQNENKDFYFYEYDRLQDPKTVKAFLNEFKPDGGFKAPINLENAEALFVSLADKEISQQDKKDLFKCLAGDIALREKVVEFENFETLSKEASKDNNLMQDGILDVVGAQQIYEDEELSKSEEKAEIMDEVLINLLEGEDEAQVQNEEKKEFDKDDIENILSDENSENKNNNLGAFAAGAAAGAIVGGAVAGSAAIAATEAGLENNLLDALPDFDFDLDLNLGSDSKEDLIKLLDESSSKLIFEEDQSNKYETREELLSELSKITELDNFEEPAEVENDSAIKAKFFGNLEEEGSENKESKTEENSNDDALQKFRLLEEEEDAENQDEVMSQVDEFLKDADFSGINTEFIGEEFDVDNLEDSSSEPEINTAPESNNQNFTQENETFSQDSQDSQANVSGEQINLLFNDEKTAEIPELSSETSNVIPETNKKSSTKDKKMIIAASIAGVVLISVLATQNGILNKNANVPPPSNAPIAAQGQAPTPLAQTDTAATPENPQAIDQRSDDIGSDPLSQPAPALQGNQQAIDNKDMGKAVSDAFLSEPVSASISKVAWEVPEDLAYNDGFRKYLQIAGKNLKLNLQNSLLLSTEMAYSNKIVIDLVINKDGSLKSNNIVTPSGSKQIDKIVLQSVKETLAYLKIPASEVSGNSVDVTLIINF